MKGRFPMTELDRELEGVSLRELPPLVAGQSGDRTRPANHGGIPQILAMEEILSGRGVFRNMVDGRKCSAASYGTIFGFEEFDAGFDVIGADRFNYHGWRVIIGYWRHNWRLSPILGILASQLARKAGLPDPLAMDAGTEAFYGAGEEEFPEWGVAA